MKRSPMKRSTKTMKRTRMGRGKHSAGIARRPTTGPVDPLRSRRAARGAVGRESLNPASWRALVSKLTERAEGRCEVPTCRHRGRLDPHHVLKRSQGGPDTEFNIVMLCRPCHEATDKAHGFGRLQIAAYSLVAPTGPGRRLHKFEGGTLGLSQQVGFIFFHENGAESRVLYWQPAPRS